MNMNTEDFMSAIAHIFKTEGDQPIKPTTLVNICNHMIDKDIERSRKQANASIQHSENSNEIDDWRNAPQH